jgi:hypothetical protein
MSRLIVSGNLNTWGTNGSYEADDSTWGFGTTSSCFVTRWAEHRSAGLYSLRGTPRLTPLTGFLDVAKSSFSGEAGKKYVAKAKVRCNSDDTPPGEDNVIVRVGAFGTTDLTNIVHTIEKTIADIKVPNRHEYLRLNRDNIRSDGYSCLHRSDRSTAHLKYF